MPLIVENKSLYYIVCKRFVTMNNKFYSFVYDQLWKKKNYVIDDSLKVVKLLQKTINVCVKYF